MNELFKSIEVYASLNIGLLKTAAKLEEFKQSDIYDYFYLPIHRQAGFGPRVIFRYADDLAEKAKIAIIKEEISKRPDDDVTVKTRKLKNCIEHLEKIDKISVVNRSSSILRLEHSDSDTYRFYKKYLDNFTKQQVKDVYSFFKENENSIATITSYAKKNKPKKERGTIISEIDFDPFEEDSYGNYDRGIDLENEENKELVDKCFREAQAIVSKTPPLDRENDVHVVSRLLLRGTEEDKKKGIEYIVQLKHLLDEININRSHLLDKIDKNKSFKYMLYGIKFMAGGRSSILIKKNDRGDELVMKTLLPERAMTEFQSFTDFLLKQKEEDLAHNLTSKRASKRKHSKIKYGY